MHLVGSTLNSCVLKRCAMSDFRLAGSQLTEQLIIFDSKFSALSLAGAGGNPEEVQLENVQCKDGERWEDRFGH